MLRILASIAPATAASMSASSKTMNGALPPSSIERRSSVSEAWAISRRPTSVEPVKDILRRRWSAISGLIVSPDDDAVMRLSTPPGRPGLLQDLGQRQHRQRRLLCGLDHHRAAGGDRRADLARAHRQREVPGGDHQARPDGLLHRQDAPGAVGGDRVAAVDADRLLREPAEELGRVGDLAQRLLDRLAHLQGHEEGQLILALGDHLEGAAQDLAALARRHGGKLGAGVDGGVQRGLGVVHRRVGDVAQRLLGGRVLDAEGALGAVAPLAGDVELLGDLVDDLLFLGGGDRGHGPQPTTAATAGPVTKQRAPTVCGRRPSSGYALSAAAPLRGRGLRRRLQRHVEHLVDRHREVERHLVAHLLGARRRGRRGCARGGPRRSGPPRGPPAPSA